MREKSIAVLRILFESEDITEESIDILRHDKRKGVQQLIKTYENRKKQKLKLESKFTEMCLYEQKSYNKGYTHIAGVDEAGRGPLAGPVVSAAVILPKNFKLIGLTDSKELSESKRNIFFDIIKREAISYGISIISNQVIDQINIYEATKRSMRDCISQLDPAPDHVLIDAVELDTLSCTSESIIKGDQKSITIAAASILAKVTRDRLMKEIHNQYPDYHFKKNMGYGTKQHLEMLEIHGATPHHRSSFAPVRKVINR